MGSLCKAYGIPGTACKEWNSLDLCALKNIEVPSIMEDDQAFMPILAEQIVSYVASTLKACDPDAILLGDNYGLSQDAPDAILEVASRHVDAITVQLSLDNFEQTGLP